VKGEDIMKNNRLIAIFMVIIMISSFLCITVEYTHECIGEECDICWQINVCQNMFKLFMIITMIFVILENNSKKYSDILKNCKNILHKDNLVLLKVKLSN
jgi:hypothetical protein